MTEPTLLERLRERKLAKWILAYSAGAWILLQVLGLLAGTYAWPAAAMRIAVDLAVIGFFLALVLAWYHGERGMQRATRGEALLLAAIVLVGAAAIWRSESGRSEPVPAPAAAPASAAKEKSIAVLAFTDLSPEHDQEYFSDGMAEEILNALAQVKDMKVAGRTSSFFYKGRNEDLRAIGKALDVANVLEGSVRKQGDKVRVTAQLIRTSDGFHLYSESFDGDIKDVFALQEKIARAITDKLQVVLSDDQSARLVNTGTQNTEAYALYLQASSIFNRREGPQMRDAIAALQEAVRLDPNYARAYARLASLHVVIVSYTGADARENDALVEKYARQATALDPKLAEPYAARALAYGDVPGELLKEREAMEQALKLDPDDVTTNFWFGLVLAKSGYRERGIALIEHALALDPLLPNALRWRGILYGFDGNSAKAEQLLTRSRDLGQLAANRELADLALARGDAALARSLWPMGGRTQLSGMREDAADILVAAMYGGDAAARQRALDLIDAYLATRPKQVSGILPVALVRLNQPERALRLLQTQQLSDTTDYFMMLWSPPGKPSRQTPEFQKLLRSYGFPALWDKYGAPDLCRKRGANDYVCE